MVHAVASLKVLPEEFVQCLHPCIFLGCTQNADARDFYYMLHNMLSLISEPLVFSLHLHFFEDIGLFAGFYPCFQLSKICDNVNPVWVFAYFWGTEMCLSK